MNLPTILILALIGIALFAALRSMKSIRPAVPDNAPAVLCSAKVKNISKTAACPLPERTGCCLSVSEKRGQAFLPAL